MTVHVLSEYESRELDLAPAAVEAVIARHLQHLDLSPTRIPGRFMVGANSYVGSIAAGDDAFLIRPKARLENLLSMMDVEIPSETWRREVISLRTDPDLLAVMARLFCVACEYVTARGLRRDYVVREEAVLQPRGRIDVARIASQPGLPSPVPCRFDDHTADIPINRVLRAAVERARRVPSLAPVWKHRLRAQLIELADAPTPIRDVTWAPTWDPGPMECHYRSAVRLAHLLLTQSSIRDAVGDVPTNTFMLNMNDLFERWVTQRLTDRSGELEVEAQLRVPLGTRDEIPMKPDITWRQRERVLAVADCKYKISHDGHGNNADYYQALAYATAHDLADAWLIYARFPGEPEGSTVCIRNTRRRVHTVTLDLTRPMSDVIEELDSISDAVRTAGLSASTSLPA